MTVDWANWTPKEYGVLCFVFNDKNQVLLMRKKRGLGAGKINAPGGRIEPGEAAPAAAIRETQEEVGITPHDPVFLGELSFQFVDGYSIHCSIFRSDAHSGLMMETDEADPFWCDLNQVPFHEMWKDDPIWFPKVVNRELFRGFFVFDGDTMLNHEMTALSQNDSY
jgi:8-oxo-dGTP diphosphatase